jgi:hypothetical protein
MDALFSADRIDLTSVRLLTKVTVATIFLPKSDDGAYTAQTKVAG